VPGREGSPRGKLPSSSSAIAKLRRAKVERKNVPVAAAAVDHAIPLSVSLSLSLSLSLSVYRLFTTLFLPSLLPLCISIGV
jgi:hypothetical protein